MASRVSRLYYVLLLVCLAATVPGFFVIRIAEEMEKSDQVRMLSQSLAPSIWAYHEETPRVTISELARLEGYVESTIYHPDGSIFITVKDGNADTQARLPIRTVETPVLYDRESIGTLRIRYQSRAIVSTAILFGVLVTASTFVVLYIRNRQRKNKLTETRKRLVETEHQLELTNLLMGLSHRINTPLGIIVTSASLLDGDSNPLTRDNEEHAETIGLIRSSADSIVRIMNRIGTLKEVHHLHTETRFRFRMLINDRIRNSQRLLESKRISVQTDIDENLSIVSRFTAWNRILTELFDNAYTHSPCDSKIRISFSETGEIYLFRFTVEGATIDSHHVDGLLKPFNIMNYNEKGVGLGLFIVKNLAEKALGGTFLIPSSDPVIFQLEIPVIRPGRETGVESSP